jgi:ORF6N domain
MSDAAEKQSSTQLMPLEAIGVRIVNLRGQRVILDSDLAALYEVPTECFNEAVKRNITEFPSDFMFQPDSEEFDSLRSQIATSNIGRDGRRYALRVFNEHAALMVATMWFDNQAVTATGFNPFGSKWVRGLPST